MLKKYRAFLEYLAEPGNMPQIERFMIRTVIVFGLLGIVFFVSVLVGINKS